jgi:hypothetical protein
MDQVLFKEITSALKRGPSLFISEGCEPLMDQVLSKNNLSTEKRAISLYL